MTKRSSTHKDLLAISECFKDEPENLIAQAEEQSGLMDSGFITSSKIRACMVTLCAMRKGSTHIQAHLFFADMQSQHEKPKELEFYQYSIKTTC